MLSAGVDMAEKLSLCFYMPVSQLVVKIGCLSAYRCSVYGAVHLRKVGRFPAISAHLRKVEFRRCTHGTPSGLLWFGFTFSTPQGYCGSVLHFLPACPPLEGGTISRVNCAPSEGEDVSENVAAVPVCVGRSILLLRKE